MKMIAVWYLCCSARSSPRIWACVVTSIAVVGSSAISRRGLHDKAIAIIARCRSPPDNCHEYASIRCSAMEIPTSRNNSTVIARAWSRPTGRLSWRSCSMIASMICEPTVCTGLNAAHRYALAAAALADDADDLAGKHVEAHAIDRAHSALVHAERHAQVAH